MLFTGEYEHTIDDKHRVAVPREIRNRLDPERHGSSFYLSPGPNGAVWIWPEKTFERMAGALEETFLPDEDTMEFEELMFSQSQLVAMDKTGRIRIPDRLLAMGGLEDSVVILGVKDHLELRSPAEWNQQREQKLARQREIMLRARRALEERTKS